MLSVRRPHGRLFQIRGPAAPKLVSEAVLHTVNSSIKNPVIAVIKHAAVTQL